MLSRSSQVAPLWITGPAPAATWAETPTGVAIIAEPSSSPTTASRTPRRDPDRLVPVVPTVHPLFALGGSEPQIGGVVYGLGRFTRRRCQAMRRRDVPARLASATNPASRWATEAASS